MDYNISLLETLYNEGFEKLINNMEELINNGDLYKFNNIKFE